MKREPKWTRDERRIYRDIGARIATRRRLCELSQQALGDAAGMTRANVANIEAGRSRIQVHTLLAFAAELMVPPSRLMPLS